MRFFKSISARFGSSTQHYNRATKHVSKAGSLASGLYSDVSQGAKHFVSKSSLGVAFMAARSYRNIAGDIIVANATLEWSNAMAAIVGGAKDVSVLARLTGFAARSLVKYPVSTMGLGVLGTVVVTHPKQTFEAVKSFSKGFYRSVKMGKELTQATAELSLALGLKAVEDVPSMVSYLSAQKLCSSKSAKDSIVIDGDAGKKADISSVNDDFCLVS